MIQRRMSRPIHIGDVTVGGGAPVIVQSMTKTDTRDAIATVDQIHRLEEYGCQIVRMAVPDNEAATSIPKIKSLTSIPLIADIHFDYRLALLALEGGVDGLRLNPGNIADREQIKMVVLAAKDRNVPIRIGVNAGSLPKTAGGKQSTVDRMVSAALEQIELLESLDFELIKVSLKAFDVPDMVSANKELSERIPYPIHLGITEAGTPRCGIIRSAVGIGILLHLGIGDTIRVSLSSDPCEEVTAGYEILKALNLSQRGPTLISCPSCGRTEVDIIGLANAVEERLQKLEKSLKVAVMGCVVNGPGEAKDADVGIACGKGRGVIFRNGKQVCTVDEANFLEVLMQEIEAF
ncbi:MAG: flavodoxin-dependent (E)-4-hydroxy-3-methylbut-2-enyl-diphosphate synthase [Dehalococcoidia bacterium]|nr:flavodoxin-dependent (E)-4-hydroxy-3-methylbut-2-enyl-diphosphate synthase [Dehalococcoidia bacterium]